MKRIIAGVVQRDETIFRVQNFFQRLMDVLQQLVQIGGFIQGMDHFDDDLALGFHALQISYVQQANSDSSGIIFWIAASFSVKPAPTTVGGAQAAAYIHSGFEVGVQAPERGKKQIKIVFMDQVDDRFAHYLEWCMTEDSVQGGVDEKYRAISVEYGQNLAYAF
jgi:hypothetical protein